jgi:hypothetical protein
MYTAFENQSVSDLEWIEKSAQSLISNGERDAAKSLLQFYSHTRADKALDLGRTLTDALDGYIKLSGQWRSPVGSQINDPGEGAETVNCLVGFDPDQPAWKQPPNATKRRRRTVSRRSASKHDMMSVQQSILGD